MGPPPKHPSQRRRTNPTIALTQLPAEGRQGEPPAWPLIPDILLEAKLEHAEAKIEQLQAERRQLEDEGRSTGMVDKRIDRAMLEATVAQRQLDAQRGLEEKLWADLWRTPMAVRWEALDWTRDVAQYVRHKVLGELGELEHAKEARLWSDHLGLNPLSLLRLRWEVAADEVGEARAAKKARPRLRAVEGGG
jgi:hypothetical protein